MCDLAMSLKQLLNSKIKRKKKNLCPNNDSFQSIVFSWGFFFF